MTHNYKAEAKALISTLQKRGFTIDKGNNGEEQFAFSEEPSFLQNLVACDEGWLYVTGADGAKSSIYLVYGNEPGVIACDYTDRPALSAAIDEHYDNYND